MIDAVAVSRELCRVRKAAGLTQTDVAQRMGTQQAAIARMERNASACLLRRLVDYAIACGYIPCNMYDPAYPPIDQGLHLIPLEEARLFLIDDPQRPLVWHEYARWKAVQILREGDPLQWTPPRLCVQMAA